MLITFILSILIIIESINTQINPLNSNNNNIKTKININANRSYFSYSPMSYSDGNKASASEFDIIYDDSDEYLNSSPSKTTNQHQKSGENHNNNINNNNNNQNYVLPVENADLKVEFCDNCDLYIGGLFPVHAPKYARQVNPLSSYSTNTGESSSSNEPISPEFFLNSKLSCGEIKKERGIQRLEAMLFAIDLINNSTSLLPHIRIGTRIYDTCDRDTIALEKCVNFVSDYFILNDDNYVNDFTCVPQGSSQWSSSHSPASSSLVTMIPHKNKHSINKRKVIGVIGAASSSVSIQVANLLRLFQVPQISYASTSPELSNKERFPFFSRVLPSDTLQAEAMANLVHDLDWNYIATLNEEGNLGGIDSFIVHAKARKICISGSYTLSQTASEDDVRMKLTEMYNERNARGVVMFLQDHNIRKILRIVKNLNYTGHFLWIASDSWGTKKESIESNDEAAEGAITFSPKSYEIKEFNEYFKKLKPKTNTRNPWFVEFWEEQFNCTMNVKKSSAASYMRRTGRRMCTGEENLNITQDSFIHFVIDSVYAMAHAIEKLVSVDCHNMASRDELIKCQKNYEFKGIKLLKEIRNVEFTSITGRKVKFIKDKENSGDGLAPYEVFQYQRLNGPDRKYGYQKITEWEKDKPFFLDRSKLKWPKSGGENNEDDNTNNKMPRSVCKEECGMGEIKQGDDCCWVCVRCEENEYVAPDRKQCTKCPNGFGPNENKTKCQKLIVEYLTFNSPFTIVPLIFSSIGILFTSYTIFVFIRFNNTPIIKASGRELCYVLLAGIMSCYLITFPLVTKPTMISCYILRFGVSLSLTVCLSALFTKTNRLSRIFNNSIKQVRQASYVSPRSQLVICFSIVSVQVVCILIWTATSQPGTMYDYEDPKRVILQCKLQNSHLALSFMYNMFLVVLCTIYAVKTRKIPENFNEARFIGFTMYSICIIWVAFIPIYFGTTAAAGTSKSPKNNYKIQLTTLAMCLSLSGTVILFCLFLPKLRVVLLKPDKNVRSKSSNIVKAVYKSHQQSVKESVIALQTSNTQHAHQPPTSHNNNNNNTTNQPTTNEKSLTIATGVSSISTPSSPGTSHKKPMLVTVNNTNQKQLNQSASAFIKQPSGEMVTPVKLKKVSISSNTQSFKLSKPSVELKAAAAEQLKTASGEQKTMETNVTAALTNAVENLHDLSLKLYENSTTSSATPTNTNVKSSSTSSLLTLLNTNNNPNTNTANINANKNPTSSSPVETFSIENQNEPNSAQNWCAEVNVPNAKISDYSVVELDQDDEDDELIDQEELEFIQVADKNYKKFLINALAIKRSQSEDVNELIIDDSMMMISNSSTTTANGNTHVKHLPTKLPTTNDLYDYYILKPRVKVPAGARPAAPTAAAYSNVCPSGTDHAMSTNNNNSNNSSSGGIVELTRSSNSNSNSTSLNSATVTNPNMSASDTRTSDLANLTIRDVYDVDQCQDLMNEEAVRSVVEKCFHQIAKKNKLSSPCIYIKKKSTASSDPSHPTEIKLIKIKPNSEKFRKIRQSIANATNNNNIKTPNNNFAQQKSTTSNNADDETLINSSSSDSSICSSSATSSSIDNQNVKQTVVEKAVDLLNAPTNTLILSSTNEVNELYSVKITFV